MARTPAETAPTPADHQQMDRSNDPATTRELDAHAAAMAMRSERQRLTGSAVGVGSVGYDEDGAFDVGDGDREPQDDPVVSRTDGVSSPARPQGVDGRSGSPPRSKS